MKKIYISPNTGIHTVQLTGMIAASKLQVIGDNATVDVTNNNNGYGGEFSSKRGYNVWEEDYDEDYDEEEDY